MAVSKTTAATGAPTGCAGEVASIRGKNQPQDTVIRMRDRQRGLRAIGGHIGPEVPDQRLACDVACDEHCAICRDQRWIDRRFMPPELSEVSRGLAPEIAPGEARRRVFAELGRDLMEDVLGQLDLAGIERLASATQAGGDAVSVGVLLALLGDLLRFLGLRRLGVGTGDVDLELPVVPGEPACP